MYEDATMSTHEDVTMPTHGQDWETQFEQESGSQLVDEVQQYNHVSDPLEQKPRSVVNDPGTGCSAEYVSESRYTTENTVTQNEDGPRSASGQYNNDIDGPHHLLSDGQCKPKQVLVDAEEPVTVMHTSDLEHLDADAKSVTIPAEQSNQALRDARLVLDKLSRRGDIDDESWARVGLARSFTGEVDYDSRMNRSGETDWSDEDSERGSIISQVESVFSEASLVSTATGFSAGSGYTPVQIATATRELLQVFQEDKSLVELYQIAIEHPDIGPERLQRNVRRLLKSFARNLQHEANKELEKLAWRLVWKKAAYVAQSIIEKFEVERRQARRSCVGDEDSSDDEDEEEEEGIHEDPVDEDLIEDLSAFRRFLIEGDAFASFRHQLKQFVSPTLPDLHDDTGAEDLSSDQESLSSKDNKSFKRIGETCPGEQYSPSLWCKIRAMSANLLIAAGYLESPLEVGWTRLRWQCVSLHSHPPKPGGSLVTNTDS